MNNNLFFMCSLVEYIGRKTKNRRGDVTKVLGQDLQRIYDYADVFHCEPIEKVADDFIQKDNICDGDFDNILTCKYAVPDYWDIGEVFARLVEDSYEPNEAVQGAKEVYESWIADKILNFNSDLYYQSREYLALCYKKKEIILA